MIDMVSQQHLVGNEVEVKTHQRKYSCRLKLRHQLDVWLELRIRVRAQDKGRCDRTIIHSEVHEPG